MLTITPSNALCGAISIPGDKSMSHRAALFAVLAEGSSEVENFLDAGVTRRMLSALTALGVLWRLEGATLQVEGGGLRALTARRDPVDCGSSATTMRLLAGVLAASGLPAELDGSDGLRCRPMDRIVHPLQAMGAPVCAENGRAPLVFSARRRGKLHAGTYHLRVASAQVKSCLLLAGLAADGPVTIVEPGPSRDHTENMLAEMGAELERQVLEDETGVKKFSTTLRPGRVLSPIRTRLPGDFSSAAFLITAALITPGSDITIHDVGLNPTRTGLLDVLFRMGARLEIKQTGIRSGEPFGVLRARHSRLRGTTIAGSLVVRMIDEFPVFAIAAAFAEGESLVRDAAELRHKESDRIRSLCRQLHAVGIPVVETADGFRLPGGCPPSGGLVEPDGDHRLAMALALAGLAGDGPVTVQRAEIIAESYPAFAAALEQLGAQID